LEGKSFSFLRGRGRYFSISAVAIIFTIIGIIVASNLDLSTKSVATDVNGNLPVVQSGNGNYSSPFVGVVEKFSNAVVNIAAEQEVQTGPYDDFFYRFFEIPRGSAVSYGSGFFFRPDGYILTNNHVVGQPKAITVRTASGYQYQAEVVGTDPQTDLAVIRVKPEESITYIPFGNSDEIRVGDWSIAIGNPFPQQGLDRTVTVGVISAKGRSNLRFGDNTPRYQDYIQTDASINPGNSGGPLLNLNGEAIGVNSAISSPSGGSVGIGFAIPINLARAVVPDLIATGKASRGWLGIYLANVTEAQAKKIGLSKVEGVSVDSVFPGGPADKAGLRHGDILIGFNGQEVNDAGKLSVMIAAAPREKEAQLTVLRDGDKINVAANIVDRDQFEAAHASQFDLRNQRVNWMGMELLTFTNQVANQIGLDYFAGIYVNRIVRNSQADRAGILPGSVITQVDNKDVKNLDDLRAITQDLAGRKGAVPILLVDPRGSIEYKALRP
jgi:serine protease Do